MGTTEKIRKKTNILSFHLLFASIERGDSALLNDNKSKVNDKIFGLLEFLQ
jgi:hypothetical protein